MTVKLQITHEHQAVSWHMLMDIHRKLPAHWTIVGGQMVHLHCAEREAFPVRPTDDADALLDVKARPSILREFTALLVASGFTSVVGASGRQHRWVNGRSQVDVLISDKLGDRNSYLTVHGAETVGTPGAAHVIRRSEDVEIEVAGRIGTIRRPTLLGALIAKAAAHTIPGRGSRHRQDFAVLAAMIRASDLRGLQPTPGEERYLAKMIAATREDHAALESIPDALDALERLGRLLTR